MDKTADKLERLIDDHRNMKDIVVTICCSCDYYDEAEIQEIIKIIDETEHLPGYARKKYKGDNYLSCQSYEKAIEEYERVFESDEILQADASVYGDLFHNMGVAYVNIGEFHKAHELFLKAYEKNGREESLAQCMYALRMSKDVETYKKLLNELEISQESQSRWEKEYQRALELAGGSREVNRVEKLRNLVRSGNMEEYYEKVHSTIAAWKNEYRRQISI